MEKTGSISKQLSDLSCVKLNKKIIIACDLFLPLKLYHLPGGFVNDLSHHQPMVEIHEANTPDKPILSRIASDAQIYFGNRINRELIQKLPKLEWIHFGSIGVDRAMCLEVADRAIKVSNSRGTMEGYVATHALSMILAFTRGLHHSFHIQQEGQLNRPKFDSYFGQCGSLEGKNILIVGFGEIGERLGKMVKSLEMNLSIVKRKTTDINLGKENIYKLEDLKTAVKGKDFVVNLLPETGSTKKLYNKDIFLAMEKNSFFINLGRGSTVDETDLALALQQGEIAGAGLDVFEKEPLRNDSKLLELENVILTPHVAGLGNNYWEKALPIFIENLINFIQGKSLTNIVNMSRGY
jgi:D-2-hydroxyacid dehydrogenase (NADP+)